jgi:hypothetical protein
MAGTSKISAVFDANTSGFVAGTKRVEAALSSLEKNVSGMRSSLGTLTAISGAQLFGSLVSVTSQAASGLIGMASAAAESIDVLSKLAARAGLTYEEIAGLQYAGDLAGVGIDEIGNALTKADKVFVAAANGSKSAAEAFSKIGISFDQLNGKSSAERFQLISDALAGMPSTAERTAAALALFGKSGAGLLPLFQEGAAGLQAMQAEAKKFGLGLTDLQGKNVEGMNDSFTRAENAIKGVVTQVVANLAPGVEKVVNMFANFVRDSDGVNLGVKIADGLYQGADYLASVADSFLAGTADVWDFVQGVIDVWSGSVTVFSKAISFAQGVFNSFSAIGSGIGAVLSYATAKMLEAAANIAAIIPGGESWEGNLRQLAAESQEANRNYMEAARNSTAEAMKNAGDLLGFEIGDSVDKAVKPTIGSIQQALRDGRDAALDAAKGVNAAGGDTGRNAGIEFRKAVEGVKIAAGIDARSSEGYSEFLRLKFGSPTDDAAERTADAAEETAEHTATLVNKLNFTVMGMS